MTEFAALTAKTYSCYLLDDADKNKKVKGNKKCVIKQNLNCLEAILLENEMNYQDKNKLDVEMLRKNHKQFIKNNRLISRLPQRFEREKHIMYSLKKLIKLH